MTLIALNVAAFVGLGLVYGMSDMLGQSGGEAHFRFALYGPSLAVNNEWYRLITSGFLHYGIIHIAFNMYILYMLGNLLEPQLGRVKFISLYFASMLGGAAGALILEPNALTAGASGAVFGLLGAACVSMWHQGINPMSTGVGRLLLFNIAFTFFLRSNVSVGGHLGGVIAGSLCALVITAPAYKGVPRWAVSVTPVAVAIAAIAISVVVVR